MKRLAFAVFTVAFWLTCFLAGNAWAPVM